MKNNYRCAAERIIYWSIDCFYQASCFLDEEEGDQREFPAFFDATMAELGSSYRYARFIQDMVPVKELLDEDVEAAFNGDPAARSKDEIVLAYPGFYAILIHRVAHLFYLHDIPLLPRIMSEIAHSRTGIDIHPGAKIGRRFFIDHGTGIVIGETAEIGEDVRIYQGVTLGAKSLEHADALRGKKRHPTIKDRVIIYSGASILGGDTVIGNDVTIGSNVFITFSVDDGKIVRFESKNYAIVDKRPQGGNQ